MNEIESADLSEQDVFVADVPDQALELAACAGPENARAFTVAFCTGNTDCPF